MDFLNKFFPLGPSSNQPPKRPKDGGSSVGKGRDVKKGEGNKPQPIATGGSAKGQSGQSGKNTQVVGAGKPLLGREANSSSAEASFNALKELLNETIIPGGKDVSDKDIAKAIEKFFQDFEADLCLEELNKKNSEKQLKIYSKFIPQDFMKKLDSFFGLLELRYLPAEDKVVLEEQLLKFVQTLMEHKDNDSSLLAYDLLIKLGDMAPYNSEPGKHYAKFNKNDIALSLQELIPQFPSWVHAKARLESELLGAAAAKGTPLTREEIAAIKKAGALSEPEIELKGFDGELAVIRSADLKKKEGKSSIEALSKIKTHLFQLRTYADKSNDAELRKKYDDCVKRYVDALIENANTHQDLAYQKNLFNEIRGYYKEPASEGKGGANEVNASIRVFALRLAKDYSELGKTEDLENAVTIYQDLGLKREAGDLNFELLKKAVEAEPQNPITLEMLMKALADNEAWLAESSDGVSNKDILEKYFLDIIERKLKDFFSITLADFPEISLVSLYFKQYGNTPEIRNIYRSLLNSFAIDRNLIATKNLLNWVEKNDIRSHDMALQFNAILFWLAQGNSLANHPAIKQLSDPSIAQTVDLNILSNIISAALANLKDNDVPTIVQLIKLLYGRGIINPTSVNPGNSEQWEYFKIFVDAMTRYEVFSKREENMFLQKDGISVREENPFDSKFLERFLSNMEGISDPSIREEMSQILYDHGLRLMKDPRLIEENKKFEAEQKSQRKTKSARNPETTPLSPMLQASIFLQGAARLGNYEALKQLAWSKDPAIRKTSVNIMQKHYSKLPTLKRMSLRRMRYTRAVQNKMPSVKGLGQFFKKNPPSSGTSKSA